MGIEGSFYSGRRTRVGAGYLFTTADLDDTTDPTLQRVVVLSTEGGYATIPRVFGEAFVAALDAHQVPVMGSKSTLAPIHGMKRQCAFYLVERALNVLVLKHGLRPVDISVHRIGDLGEVPLEQITRQLRDNPSFLRERGVQIAPDDVLMAHLPFMAAVRRAAAASSEAPHLPGSQGRKCYSNIDLRVHFTGVPGDATVLLRKGDGFRGGTGRCHHLLQLGFQLAQVRELNITSSELPGWLSGNEIKYGGSVTVYLRPGVTSKSGAPGEGQSNTPPGFAPNTFCAYCHNGKVKALDVAACVGAAQRTVSYIHRPTNGQAAAALDEITRLLGAGLQHGDESVDFEINCTIGSHLEGADSRELLLGVVRQLSNVILSGAVELQACIPRAAVRGSIRCMCARLKEGKYFSGRKGGRLNEAGVLAWYSLLSVLGVSVDFSAEGKYQQGLVLTNGPAAGSLRFLRGFGVQRLLHTLFESSPTDPDVSRNSFKICLNLDTR